MITIPDHLKGKKLSRIILHNVYDNINLMGERWLIILCEDKSEIIKVPERQEESPIVRLHEFDCKMKDVHFAVMIATSWLYDNKVWFETISIHTSDNIL